MWAGPSSPSSPCEAEGQVRVRVPSGESEFTVRPQAGLGGGHQSRGNLALTPFQTHPFEIRKWDQIQAWPPFPGSTPGRQGQSTWDGAPLPGPR